MDFKVYLTKKRYNALKYDNEDLMNRTKRFLNKLQAKTPQCEKLKVFEMYETNKDNIKSKKEIYCYFNKFRNSRLKLNHETEAEVDKLSKSEAEKMMIYGIENLINKGYHFAVFGVMNEKGELVGRSFHIRIYDLYELEDLDSYKREVVQREFWKDIFGVYFSYLDKSVWSDEHPLQIEFRPHYKYGYPFSLFMEYVPEVQKCN